MRSALRQRESDLQYRKVAEHFANLDIHPGYLAELEPKTLNRQVPTSGTLAADCSSVATPARKNSGTADYIAFGFSLMGLIISVTAVLAVYLQPSQSKTQPRVVPESTQLDPNIARLEESVRRLSLALTTIVARIEKDNFPSDRDTGIVVEVVVNKANLRIAPGTEASSVMAVSRGTKLLVDTEEAQWLRVFAPNGQSLWVARDVVSAERTPRREE